MAGKNITIAGATFNGVPSIDVPVSGGGTASFVEISDTTAQASDVAQGKFFYDAQGVKTEGSASGGGGVDVEALSVTQNGTYTAPSGKAYSPVTVNVSGGGSSGVAKKDVNFIDYDGTILYSYTAEEAQELTELPANPSHSGLTSQGWNYTLAQVKTEVVAQGKCTIGQMYVTDDGKTRLYCHFEEGRLSPFLGVYPEGTVTVDWGDGTATSTLTGTSLTTIKTVQHIYATAGDYVITLAPASGTTYALQGSTAAGSRVLNKTSSGSGNVSMVYFNAIQRVELGSGVSINNNAFRFCRRLASITVPSGVTAIGEYAFYYCISLPSITIPSTVTSIGTYALQYCQGLESVSIPSAVTRITGSLFNGCYRLASVTIPSTVTAVGSSTFSGCSSLIGTTLPPVMTSIEASMFYQTYSLTNITIPPAVTSIGSSAFNSCYGLVEIHFKPSTPPTVSGSTTWSGIPADCIIYVPSGKLSAYTSASNYPSSSTYTYIEE